VEGPTREETMIHHLSIAARDPKQAAGVLAELMGGPVRIRSRRPCRRRRPRLPAIPKAEFVDSGSLVAVGRR
jgi:hypothetical protein